MYIYMCVCVCVCACMLVCMLKYGITVYPVESCLKLVFAVFRKCDQNFYIRLVARCI